MSIVRLLGFNTLSCGCVIGRYRERSTGRELTYVETKGTDCQTAEHRQNHTVLERRPAARASLSEVARSAHVS